MGVAVHRTCLRMVSQVNVTRLLAVTDEDRVVRALATVATLRPIAHVQVAPTLEKQVCQRYLATYMLL